jgi:subtilisin family serine protease
MKATKLASLLLFIILVISCSKQEGLMDEMIQLKNNSLMELSGSLADREKFIVVFKENVTVPAMTAESICNSFGLKFGYIYQHVFKGFSAAIPAQLLNQLRNHPMIDYIEKDIILQANTQTIPTGIKRIGTETNTTAAIDGVDQEISVDVAVLDTGIDKDHPDLDVRGGVRFFYTMFTDSRYDDDNGHGSHVAGIIGARDNGIGVVGVAPHCRLYAVKVLNSRGSGYLSDIIKGLDWVRERAGTIEIINMSLGGTGLSTAYRTAIVNCVKAGIVVVTAAGNESSDVYGADGVFGTDDDVIPASYPEAAAISSLADSDGKAGGSGPATSFGSDDSFASFSNFSRSIPDEIRFVNSPGLAIDLMLPGVDILSTYKDGAYATMSGTSMASPHAAGLVALYIAKKGRAYDAQGVYAIRQALIDAGKTQASAEGLSLQNDPDGNTEKIGWAGAESIPENNPAPVANFSYVANNLTVTFTDLSTDNGTMTQSWNFGDGSSSSTKNPVHTYAAAGTYNVTLTVTDNGGLTDAETKSITVTTPPEESIVLKAVTSSVFWRYARVALSWTPSGTIGDIYRNGTRIASNVTDSYNDFLMSPGTYKYQIKSSSGIWSNIATIKY